MQFTKLASRRLIQGFTDAKVAGIVSHLFMGIICPHRTITNTRSNKGAFAGV
jgi:hypothetical protein